MGLWGRFILYKLDCLVMLCVIGVQFALFRHEQVFDYYPGDWLGELFNYASNLWLVTIVGATIYWVIVDYHPALERLRQSRIVTLVDGQRPDFGTRLVRSLVKAVTLFSFQGLLLCAVFDKQRRFAHDRVTDTHRVAVTTD